jgi:hypothetical protein
MGFSKWEICARRKSTRNRQLIDSSSTANRQQIDSKLAFVAKPLDPVQDDRGFTTVGTWSLPIALIRLPQVRTLSTVAYQAFGQDTRTAPSVIRQIAIMP